MSNKKNRLYIKSITITRWVHSKLKGVAFNSDLKMQAIADEILRTALDDEERVKQIILKLQSGKRT